MRSTGSKCDADNSHWGSRDMWARYDSDNEFNLPVVWAKYELKYPCPLSQRRAWPMASPTGDGKPFKLAGAAADHKTICVLALGETEGRKITPHVHRVTLATSIMALDDGDEPTAQAMVRHKTVEALRTYYKFLPTKYADVLDRATRVDAAKHTNLTCPEIDPFAEVERIDATIDGIEQTTDTATRKGKGGGRSATNDDACTISQFVIGEMPDGAPIYVDADTENDPHNVVGESVSLPNELWPGYERCRARCKRGKMCGKCKAATSCTMCDILAFSDSEGIYVLDAEGQHYAFHYDQIKTHFTERVKAVARETTAAPARGKAPVRAAPQRHKRRRH